MMKALLYIVSQCVGGLLASVTLRLLVPGHATLGATIPAGAAMQSFVLELVMTSILMFVILSVSTGAKEKGITAGIAVGGVQPARHRVHARDRLRPWET